MRTKRKTKKMRRMHEALQAAAVALLSRLAPPAASAPAVWTPPAGPQLPARFTAEIREGAGAFVVLIIAAAAIVIAAAVGIYVLNALAPATGNTEVVAQGQQAIQNTVSSFGVVASLLGALVVGVIAFGFLKRIWKEFAGA
jgi:anti-sigma factor RsiW